MTVVEAVRRAEQVLESGQVPNARFDAEVLLAHALGTGRDRLIVIGRDEVPAVVLETYDRLVQRRSSRREPLQYITGRQEFYSLEFLVDARVLVPRPETEMLVDRVLLFRRDEAAAGRAVRRVADVGTGSGCIAIALAVNAPDLAIVATDLSEGALDLARLNAERFGAGDRIEFLLADLLESVTPGLFDAIVSNPPYVSCSEWDGMQPEVKDHEPRIALVGEASGLDPYERLLPQAAARLRPGGLLALEVSGRGSWSVLEMFQDGTWDDAQVTLDFQKIPRMVTARRAGSRSPGGSNA